MFDQLDPSKLTASAVLLTVIVSMLRGWLVPGSIYKRALADIDLKDKLIDRLTITNERLSRARSNNRTRE